MPVMFMSQSMPEHVTFMSFACQIHVGPVPDEKGKDGDPDQIGCSKRCVLS